MFRNLILSLAVAAASGVSFVGSPKKSVDFNTNDSFDIAISIGQQNDFIIRYEIGSDYDEGPITEGDEWESDRMSISAYPQDPDETWAYVFFDSYNAPIATFNVSLMFNTDRRSNDDQYIYQNFVPTLIAPGVQNASLTNNYFGDVGLDEGEDTLYTDYYYTVSFSTSGLDQGDGVIVKFAKPANYSLTKSFVNCDIASSPRLPDNFTPSSQLSYYVLMVSNAGGYGFTSQSVTQTGGITIRNFNLFDQYNNSGYYASCSFNVDLPLNNCSLSVTAFLPQYTITSTLEHCTVSPALPASYTGTSFSGDYTFTSESGYGFNKNYTHWEVSNLFVDSVEFSSLLWGSFYSSVTLHLRASGGNSSISVTAIKYDEESYKLGYEEGREDGWQAGYDRGHADGEIAGDSYGVWNWLKQAAITTGEFLNIPLLPGFSIGGLLTALAGLVIIWFFIRGFLFKS